MSVRLKPEREYEHNGGQWRRVKQAPPEPKRCQIIHTPTGLLMDYDEQAKLLSLAKNSEGYEFPAKTKAQSAIWWTVQKLHTSYDDYQIEVLDE